VAQGDGVPLAGEPGQVKVWDPGDRQAFRTSHDRTDTPRPMGSVEQVSKPISTLLAATTSYGFKD